MISASKSASSPDAEESPGEGHPPAAAGLREDKTAYGAPFWNAYVANLLVMVACSLLFRYADFVQFLGGTEFHLGWIVGIGMVGSLAMRFAQGRGIDRYGARRIWLASAALLCASSLAHLLIERADTVAVYLVRIVFATSVAGVFGASITSISLRAPQNRLGEVLGMLGTSGFLGMMTGTLVGDLMFGEGPVAYRHIAAMFLTAAGLAAVSMVFIMLATRGEVRHTSKHRPPLLWTFKRYHPGAILLVAAVGGMGLTIPQTFLRPFAAELGISGIAIFFWVYAPAAFAIRLLLRRWPDRLGVRPSLIMGLSFMAAGFLAFLLVSNQWQLLVPAILVAVAHAMIFPAIMAGGTSSFPARYRGIGTALVLAMFDLGSLCGAPAAGVLLRVARLAEWPRYPTMFTALAVVVAMVVLWYATRASRLPRRRVRGGVAASPVRLSPVAGPPQPVVLRDSGNTPAPAAVHQDVAP